MVMKLKCLNHLLSSNNINFSRIIWILSNVQPGEVERNFEILLIQEVETVIVDTEDGEVGVVTRDNQVMSKTTINDYEKHNKNIFHHDEADDRKSVLSRV